MDIEILSDGEADIAQDVIAIFGLCCVCLIGLPTWIICWIGFRAYKKEPMIEIRSVISHEIALIVFGIHCFVLTPLALIDLEWNIFNWTELSPKIVIYRWFHANVSDLALLISANILLRLALRVQRSIELREWRKELNPNYHETSLLLKYYHLRPYLTYVGIAHYTAVFCANSVLAVIFFNHVHKFIIWEATVQVLYSSLIIIAGMYSLCTLFRFNDAYHAQKESKIILCVLGPFVIISYVLVVLFSNRVFLNTIFVFVIIEILEIVGWTIMILYPICIVFKQDKTKSIEMLTFKQNSENIYNKKSRRKSMTKNDRLVAILTNKDKFESFANHLNREFCAENLLFVVYIIQFQNYLLEQNKSQNKIMQVFVQDSWNLPSTVPISPIFMNNDKFGANSSLQDRFEYIFDFLFEKFIERGQAKLEINISDSLRVSLHSHKQKLNKQLENRSEFDIFEVWQDLRLAALQTWTLLGSAETRFKMPPFKKHAISQPVDADM